MCILIRHWRAVHTKVHTCAWFMARVAEKNRLNICANNKGADQPACPRRLISTFVVRCSSFFFFFPTKKRLTTLNGEQNDTWNLLVCHRICHFRAIQPFDFVFVLQYNFNDSNTNGSFTVADTNSFWVPRKVFDSSWKQIFWDILRIFSYFIMKMCILSTL